MRVEGLGFRVEGLGLRVEGLGLCVEGLGLRVEGLGWRIPLTEPDIIGIHTLNPTDPKPSNPNPQILM